MHDLENLTDKNLDTFIDACMESYRDAKSIGAHRSRLKLIELKIGLACKEWKRRHPNTLPPCFAGRKPPAGYKIYSWPKK